MQTVKSEKATELSKGAKSLVESARQAESAATRKARDQYRELIARNDPADSKVVLKLMGQLGIDVDQLGCDQEILAEASRLEQAEATADDPALAEEIEAASEAWKAYRVESEEIARQREREAARLFGEFQRLGRQRDAGRNARRQLASLRQTHAELFGLEPVADQPEVGLVTLGGEAAVRVGNTVSMLGQIPPAAKGAVEHPKQPVCPTPSWPGPNGTASLAGPLQGFIRHPQASDGLQRPAEASQDQEGEVRA